ncbi:enoyl-CoA hydratase/isomerase family protein [Tropicibacter naphthalenivorans]|uniref:Putative enoyl-CoA hydratase echA8 n=1 Tax=Tropicibacter naphthalenivorans TaxID=441103 RepID=A0A0P1H287_9RHOB|nr:enoyl-CoA hydratase-related protein [Tropicibacter naphthalenivorans]CUH81322.1 putative enoyl-CoA hydratase echA8 [Tropicibacter naphthalenivorans]SMC98378.1 2-(1,2-epoxy-1,2-dihydrophenyl)acetyl-CoA isomerase [Tropicibacter naphthalenivorans]
MSDTEELLFDVSNGVATITINRPDKRNSFHDDMVRQWVAWLDECKTRGDVQAIVFTGTEGSFSAGGDTSRFKGKSEQTPLEAKAGMTANTQSLARKVAEIDKPIIAAINGMAVGGGLDLALMCDVRVMSSGARVAETYAKMGLIPGVGGAWFLPRIIGEAAALDMFWICHWVDAREALQLGLVNRVFPEDSFAAEARAYAEQIAAAAPLSVRFIKRMVKGARDTDLHSHLDALSSHIALVRTSNDHKEAVAAFKEKRTPTFTGT